MSFRGFTALLEDVASPRGLLDDRDARGVILELADVDHVRDLVDPNGDVLTLPALQDLEGVKAVDLRLDRTNGIGYDLHLLAADKMDLDEIGHGAIVRLPDAFEGAVGTEGTGVSAENANGP